MTQPLVRRCERAVFKAASGMPGWCVRCERRRVEHVDREPGTAAHFGYCPSGEENRLSLQEHERAELERLRAMVERLRAAGEEAVRRGAESRWAVEIERDRYREALAELVRLKDGPRDDAYRVTKDAAWDTAREALDG